MCVKARLGLVIRYCGFPPQEELDAREPDERRRGAGVGSVRADLSLVARDDRPGRLVHRRAALDARVAWLWRDCADRPADRLGLHRTRACAVCELPMGPALGPALLVGSAAVLVATLSRS